MNLPIWIKEANPRSILIIRSCQEQMMKKLIDDIYFMLPDIQIDLIVQKGYTSSTLNVRNEFKYEKTFYNIFNINFLLFKEIRSNKYDAVIIPCSNTSGEGYLNVKLFSLPIRARSRLLLCSNYNILFFSRRKIVMEYLHTRISRYILVPIKFVYYYAIYHVLCFYKKLKINLH